MPKVPVQIIQNPRTSRAVLFDPETVRAVSAPLGEHDLASGSSAHPSVHAFSPQEDRKWQHLMDLLGAAEAPGISIKHQHITELVIGNTYTCNMGCTYCYNELDIKPIKGSESSGGMPLNIAYRAIKETVAQVPEGEELAVLFVGGEPLLEREVLYTSVSSLNELASKRGVRLAFAVYTNATMLNDEIFTWGAANNVSFVVSIDGPGKLNAARVLKSGRPTSRLVLRNIRRMIERHDQPVMRVRSVTTPSTPLLPLTKYLHDLGFNEIHIQALYSEDGISTTSYSEYMDLLSWWTELMIKGTVIDVQPFSTFLQKLMVRTRSVGAWYPCMAGRNAMTVGPDGRIYSCHHGIEEDQYQMGHINDGIPSIDDRRPFFREVDARTPCNQCWAKHMCGGECYHRSTSAGLGMFDTMDEICNERRELIAASLDSFLRIAEERPDSLIRLLRADLTHATPNNAAYEADDLSAYLQ